MRTVVERLHFVQLGISVQATMYTARAVLRLTVYSKFYAYFRFMRKVLHSIIVCLAAAFYA